MPLEFSLPGYAGNERIHVDQPLRISFRVTDIPVDCQSDKPDDLGVLRQEHGVGIAGKEYVGAGGAVPHDDAYSGSGPREYAEPGPRVRRQLSAERNPLEVVPHDASASPDLSKRARREDRTEVEIEVRFVIEREAGASRLDVDVPGDRA